MINPVFLRTFLSLSDTKSFTKTAQLLHMTQPGVSQHVKWLEDYFSTPLISRDGKKFDLTDQGEKVLEYGKVLFEEHKKFKEIIGMDDPHEGVCRFASPGSFGLKMYSFLLSLNRKNPKLVIKYSYSPNTTIIRDVLEDKVDVGFITRKPEEANLYCEIIEEEELQILVPPSFTDFSFSGLKKIGFINHPDGFHHASRLLQENFPKEFIGMEDFAMRGFINQITRIPEPVALGLGFTALPEYAVSSFSNKHKPKVYPLKKRVYDPIYKIYKKHRKLPSRFHFIFEEYKR